MLKMKEPEAIGSVMGYFARQAWFYSCKQLLKRNESRLTWRWNLLCV